jgi:hypothetical protein
VLSPWGAVRVCSRRGAAHRRRGSPCQDASLALRLLAPQGEPLLLLAVADGHGATRHSRSQVGSALACRAAAAALQEALLEGGEEALAAALAGGYGAGRGGAGEGLPPWLAAGWPQALWRHWRAATEAHWRAQPDGAPGPYSPIPYGTTLGLLLLAPGWWAYAGLGDWDLVRLPSGGGGELLSQEPALPGAGEATASLCQEGPTLLGWRSGLEVLPAGAAPFALVLSTDGVRKSCASDGDFLALCPQLAALVGEAGQAGEEEESSDGAGEPAGEPAGEGPLAAALDQISAEGCGDDSSVAIAHWAPTSAAEGAAGQGLAGHSLTAPSLGLSSGLSPLATPSWPAPPRGGPSRGGAIPGAFPGRFPAPQGRQRACRQEQGGVPGFGGPQRPGSAPLGLAPLGLALAGLGLLGLGLGVLVPRILGPGFLPSSGIPWPGRPRPPAPPEPGEPWRREVGRLCRVPELVGPSLASRRSQVEALRRGSLRPEVLLAERSRDPLGALLAAGFPALPAAALRQSGFQQLPLCPELRRALVQLWSPPPPVLPIAPRPPQ